MFNKSKRNANQKQTKLFKSTELHVKKWHKPSAWCIEKKLVEMIKHNSYEM